MEVKRIRGEGLVHQELGEQIIGAAFEVRRNCGKGLREAYYKGALALELSNLGLKVDREVKMPALYKGIEIDDAYYADIVVENKIILEVKALKFVGEAEVRQLVTYLELSKIRLGYLINFGVDDFCICNLKRESFPYKHGIYRIVH